jgi:nucleoside-diphosphate-sugar epimerase
MQLASSSRYKRALEQLSPAIINVGSDEQNLTIASVAKLIRREVPWADLTIKADDHDRQSYQVSFRLIREGSGFTPRWTIESGIPQVMHVTTSGHIRDSIAISGAPSAGTTAQERHFFRRYIG